MSYGDAAVKLARVASGKSQEKAAAVIGVSLPTYAAREKVPRSFSIEELEDLQKSSSDEGKQIIWEFVREIFLPR